MDVNIASVVPPWDLRKLGCGWRVGISLAFGIITFVRVCEQIKRIVGKRFQLRGGRSLIVFFWSPASSLILPMWISIKAKMILGT